MREFSSYVLSGGVPIESLVTEFLFRSRAAVPQLRVSQLGPIAEFCYLSSHALAKRAPR